LKRPKLEILDPEDIQKIITAAYDLLENFGVMVDNDEALEILEGGGAGIDFKEKIAYIPAGMVDKALETRPSRFAIYDQECKMPAVLEKDNIHSEPRSGDDGLCKLSESGKAGG
jgi:trimethylamine--corrinoid protein Co-methyltransferase